MIFQLNRAAVVSALAAENNSGGACNNRGLSPVYIRASCSIATCLYEHLPRPDIHRYSNLPFHDEQNNRLAMQIPQGRYGMDLPNNCLDDRLLPLFSEVYSALFIQLYLYRIITSNWQTVHVLSSLYSANNK